MLHIYIYDISNLRVKVSLIVLEEIRSDDETCRHFDCAGVLHMTVLSQNTH